MAGFMYDVEKAEIKRTECEVLNQNATLDPFLQNSTEPFCPWTFDDWACWNNTPANTTVYNSCPGFVLGFDINRLAHKTCMEDGTWLTHPFTNRTWSNYTTCVNTDALTSHRTINWIYIVGYSISLVALLMSLGIFFRYRQLKCKRVTIHKNLFSSFFVNNALWLIWHLVIVENPKTVVQNGVACQFLHVLLHYFLVSNYFWMFCEGLYLHTLLVITFIQESKVVRWFLLIGWGAPFLFTVIYSISRALDATHNQLCWMDDSPYNYILSVPVVISMVINLFFLINIVRVLVTKLRAANAPQDTHSTRKAVRATLILIPLLGLHYVLTPFKPPEGSQLEFYYLITSAITSSFQGLAVSLLFCFFNGEVLAIIKKKWNQRQMIRSPQSYAATTVSYVKNNSSMADGVTVTTNYVPNEEPIAEV